VKIRVKTKPAGLAGHKSHTTVPIHVDARASSLQCFQARTACTLCLSFWGRDKVLSAVSVHAMLDGNMFVVEHECNMIYHSFRCMKA
jgi:hypothetical protein